nr:immunoglobulin light chain junction region [Macaca mulatta]
GMQGKEFPLTF